LSTVVIKTTIHILKKTYLFPNNTVGSGKYKDHNKERKCNYRCNDGRYKEC